MKLEFKFGITGIISFAVLCGLFYWLCPLPTNPVWRALVCGAVVLFAFAASFVVVTHQGIIRRTQAPKKRKNK